MKILISVIFLIVSLNADEMQRIENIVNDIAKLRVNYEECSAQLKEKNEKSVSFKAVEYKSDESENRYKSQLKSEKEKNDKLLKEVQSLKKKSSQNDSLKSEVISLKKLVQTQKNLISKKEKIVVKKQVLKNQKIKFMN